MLAPPPARLRKHSLLRTHGSANYPCLWRQSRLANVTCAGNQRLCIINLTTMFGDVRNTNYGVRQNILLYYTQLGVCRKVPYPLLKSPYSVSIHPILMICYSSADWHRYHCIRQQHERLQPKELYIDWRTCWWLFGLLSGIYLYIYYIIVNKLCLMYFQHKHSLLLRGSYVVITVSTANVNLHQAS